jgi:hypothetical protein
MPTYDGGVSNPGFNVSYTFRLNTSENTNPSANTSTINWNIQLIKNDFAVWNLNSGQTSWGANIGGYTYGGTFAYDFRNYSSLRIYGTTTGAIAHNSDGSKSISVSASFSGAGPLVSGSAGGTMVLQDFVLLPSSPPSVTAAATGLNVVVSSGQASTPGPAISNYWVSFASSSNGGVSFGSWSSETAMVNRQHTYTLTPGLTYKFRVRAQNSDGYGGFTESSTLFLTAGGKRFDATANNWALTAANARRWNGTSWATLTTLKRFDGTNWVNLS